MTKRSLFAFAIVNTLIVALIASYLTTKWHHHHEHHHPSGGGGSDFHRWLHSQLDLTQEQQSSLQPKEDKFEKQSAQIRENIRKASLVLAESIKSGDPDHPKIASSLSEISSHQADLRKLMVEHFFEMKEHLDPEQEEKVRQWIYDSLISQHPSKSTD